MVIASCRITLHLPEARSLKDKRRLLQGLVRRLRDRHNASVIEVEERDLWQKAVLAVALAAPDRGDAQARLQRIRCDVEETTGLKYVDFEPEIH